MEKDIKNEELEAMQEEEECAIVVLTDEQGVEHYFAEEAVIPVGDKNFAVLVGVDVEDCCEDPECHCHEHEHEAEEDDEENVIIARIDFDENGEPVYVGPTDEEFEAAKKAYAEMFPEEEE